MTRQFRKREDLHLVIIPGMGRLRPNQILSGDQYAKFVPHLLEEVLPAKSAAPVVPAAVAPAPAAPVPELVVKKSSPPPVVEETPAPVEAEAVLFVEEPVVEAPAEAPVEESEDSEEDTDSELEDGGEAEGEPAPAEHHQHAGTVAAPPRRKRGRPRKGS